MPLNSKALFLRYVSTLEMNEKANSKNVCQSIPSQLYINCFDFLILNLISQVT